MEIHNETVNMSRDAALSRTMVCKLALKFKCGCTSTENDTRVDAQKQCNCIAKM